MWKAAAALQGRRLHACASPRAVRPTPVHSCVRVADAEPAISALRPLASLVSDGGGCSRAAAATAVATALAPACNSPARPPPPLSRAQVDPADAPYLYYVLNQQQELLVLSIGLGVGVAAVIGTLRFIRDWWVGRPRARVAHRALATAAPSSRLSSPASFLPWPALAPSPLYFRPLKPLIYITLAPTIGVSCYMQWGERGDGCCACGGGQTPGPGRLDCPAAGPEPVISPS